MKKVTKVTRQRKPGRYNVYLDDEFALAVDEKILIKYDLFKGTELEDDALKEIEAAEFEQKAYTKALVYACLLYTSPSPRDGLLSRMPSSA